MNTAYKKEIWDQYAQPFISVMPSQMLELNTAVATLATGNVCDFGCGAGKIAPFILDNPNVTSYTGIDYSLEMVKQARWHLKQFPQKKSEIIHAKIECIDTEAYDIEIISGITNSIESPGYDFGLSINSYYTWDNSNAVLETIYNALNPNASFVLVTPNKQLDMVSLLEKAKRELVAHPYFKTFKEQNMALVGNEKALFVDMDKLVEQVRKIGFKVTQVHQVFYDGGLNFLHLKK